MPQAQTIDEVIETLDEIIATAIRTENPIGYFAALYRKVTVSVKKGIENNAFENGPRMEKLDVIFANRFIEAYAAHQQKESCSKSWQVAFDMAAENKSIVLQHLMIGMNAHINLDLGIAAATVSNGTNLADLHTDFNKINNVLSSLVQEVQNDLSKIWPTLTKLLKWSGKLDDKITDFSMEIARNGAWKFAQKLAETPSEQWENCIAKKDERVKRNVLLINPSALGPRFIIQVIRLGEKGNIASRIEAMQQ
jgi:hypothetical protein